MAARQRRLIIYLPHRQPIWRLPEGYLETIRRRAMKTFEIDIPMNEEAFVSILPGAEVLFAWGIARRHVDKADALRWLHTPLAGVDRVLNPELLKSPVRITSSRGVNSVAVAEHTLGLILSMTRGIAEAVRAQGESRWAQQDLFGRKPPLLELRGKILGILGLGDIGRDALVPESGLVGGRRGGWIAGAAVGGSATEPLPPGSPLWRLPQVVMTPHIAGTHPQYMERAADLFIPNLKRYLGGGPRINEVDKQAGY